MLRRYAPGELDGAGGRQIPAADSEGAEARATLREIVAAPVVRVWT